jgi:hypothetical protein
MLKFVTRSIPLVLLAAAYFGLPFEASAQRRDYMTEAEVEIVRDAQDLDKRIEVLTKMIDRRLVVLGLTNGAWKPSAKQSETWGEEPAGTRLQLLNDVRLLIQKGIDDVDDVAMHNENAQAQNKKEGQIFPRAVRLFADAATRYKPVLKTAAQQTKDERELGSLLSSIDFCDQIIEAASKLPPETAKGKKN